jgi:hypothetical protein
VQTDFVGVAPGYAIQLNTVTGGRLHARGAPFTPSAFVTTALVLRAGNEAHEPENMKNLIARSVPYGHKMHCDDFSKMMVVEAGIMATMLNRAITSTDFTMMART